MTRRARRLRFQNPPGHCHNSLLRMNHDLLKCGGIARRGALDQESQRCLIPGQGVSRQSHFYG